MAYVKKNWQNTPSTNTPINADNLNHMEQGIYDAAETADYAKDKVDDLQGLVYSPLVAATAAAMTDTTKVYVYTGSEAGYTSGHWYYYNGSAWADGGVYNSTAFNTDTTLSHPGEAADAEATGDAVSGLRSALNNGYYSTHQTWGIGYVNGSVGDTYTIVSHNTRRYLVITPTEELKYTVANGYYVQKDEIDGNDKITKITTRTNNVLSPNQKYGLTLRKTDNTDISTLDVETVCPILFYPPVLKKIPVLEEKTSALERSYSKNLFDPNAEGVINGKYLNTIGVPTDGVGWHISDFIKVSDLENIVGSVWSENGSYYAYSRLNYMHSYDDQFNHLAKIWDQSSDGKYAVGEGVAYIKFCWENGEVASNRKIMLESGTAHSADYVPYKETNYLDGSAYPTFAETEEMIANGGVVPSDDIVCWGDSLTYSQYASDNAHRYTGVLATLSGRRVYNWGMPGANSDDIGGLQGGLPIYVDPFTLPASGASNAVTLRDANMSEGFIGLMHHSPRFGWVNDIEDMGLTWKIENEDVSLFYSSPNMKVSRNTTAEEATVYSRPIKISSQHNYAKSQIQIFWVGTNDAPNTAEKAQRTVRQVKAMVDFYGGDRYLVLGMTVKAYADECNAIFAQTFGNHYVDVKYYLINYGLYDNGITPTAQDETDISNGVVPTSLRSDSVHFNDYGYNAIAKCVHQHGKDLGYWGDAE